ncbi:unnamed protein product [Coregonus sp. 'balchen']|nr:unnamed protein product [Coregonus sp. 'balchen']
MWEVGLLRVNGTDGLSGPKGDRGRERGGKGVGASGTPRLEGHAWTEWRERTLRAWNIYALASAWASSPASPFPLRACLSIHTEVYVISYHITLCNRPLLATLVINGLKKLQTRDSLTSTRCPICAGDQVWLEMLRDWNRVYSSSKDYSTFIGFLLYADPKA